MCVRIVGMWKLKPKQISILLIFARTILIVVRSRTLIIHVDLILETTTGINSLEHVSAPVL